MVRLTFKSNMDLKRRKSKDFEKGSIQYKEDIFYRLLDLVFHSTQRFGPLARCFYPSLPRKLLDGGKDQMRIRVSRRPRPGKSV